MPLPNYNQLSSDDSPSTSTSAMGKMSRAFAARGDIDSDDGQRMAITGFKKFLPFTVLSNVGYVLTLGCLRLVFHWFPILMLNCTHRKCPLSEATKILAKDTYDEKFTDYHIEDVIETQITQNKIPASLRLSKSGQTEPSTTKVIVQNGMELELSDIRLVTIKKLTYVWVPRDGAFLKLEGLNNAMTKSQLHSCPGLTRQEQQFKRSIYGENDISVPMPSIWTLIFLEILNPFYFFQAFSILVWILDDYYTYCLAVVVMSIFGISTSVIETYKNEKSFHDLINKAESVTVRRKNNLYETIKSSDLVPGDIVVVPRHGFSLLYDAVVLDGNCIVDESMLTGESLPVSKTALGRTDDLYNIEDDARHTLFSGTRVIHTKLSSGNDSGKVHAVVVNTGFSTTKGGLIRSILYPPPADYAFDDDSYSFIWILGFVGLGGIVYTCVLKWNEENFFNLVLDTMELLTTTVPSALPASMTIGKIYALKRLKKRKISCINSRVINVSGSTNFVCFDKTGTLTEGGFDLSLVIPIEDKLMTSEMNDVKTLPFSHLIYGMATCHSLALVDGQLVGDPLEEKMLEWASYDIEDTLEDSFTRVSPKNNQFKAENELRILHEFQFLSKLQRMSVITNRLNDPSQLIVYCKGSPEMIASLSTPESVPADYLEKLKVYTSKGYRVIAVAWRFLSQVEPDELPSLLREDVEKDLTLCGLLVFENELKPQTRPTIDELKRANLSIVMITGDNLQTAVSVARECGIMGGDKEETASFEENVLESESDWDEFLRNSRVTSQTGNLLSAHAQLAMTGAVWNKIKADSPQLLSEVLAKTPVLARMTSEQKKQVILELQTLGYTVAMCGDGANDCRALKAANVGVSLSKAEASAAAPFTYREENISCIPTVIKEGRAALSTSFGIFKFMVLYSYTEFFSTILLYYAEDNLTDVEFLIIDCGIIVVSAFFFGQTQAYKHDLVDESLPRRLFSPIPLISMLFQVVLTSVTQIISYEIIRLFPWFEPFKAVDRYDFASYENYAVYCLSQFQYITFAVIFSTGPPFRQRMYTNLPFTIAVISMTLACLYITLYPANWTIVLIQLKFPPDENFPAILVGLALFYFVISVVLEDFLVNYIFAKKLKFR